MKELLIATGNAGKFQEISEILQDLPLKLYSLNDFKVVIPESIEDGNTYAENSLKKARYVAQRTHLMCLADDSGIVVDALKDELGTMTRRWGAGSKVSDQEWVTYFLKRMETEKNRTAKFICHAYLVNPQGEVLYHCEGETKGIITPELLAPIIQGLPLSSCFVAEGYDKVLAAMTVEEKNQISHRGKAIKQMKEYLQQQLPY